MTNWLILSSIKHKTRETEKSATQKINYNIDTNGLLNDKRGEFNICFINYPYLDCNMATAPVYGVYISQFILYARDCRFLFSAFLQRRRLLSIKLLNQWSLKNRLILSFKHFFMRYQHLVHHHYVTCVHMARGGIVNYS